MEQSRKNASEAEAEDRKWSRTGGQGNGISDLDNAGLQGLYLHIVDKGSDEDSKLWMKGKASRGGESRCEYAADEDPFQAAARNAAADVAQQSLCQTGRQHGRR